MSPRELDARTLRVSCPPPLFWIFEALTLGFPLENVFILPNLGRVPPPGLVGTFFREP